MSCSKRSDRLFLGEQKYFTPAALDCGGFVLRTDGRSLTEDLPTDQFLLNHASPLQTNCAADEAVVEGPAAKALRNLEEQVSHSCCQHS